MTAPEILTILQEEIHSTVFATVDETGLPRTCVIDVMLADESGLYFLTAKGKSFYERLTQRPFAAISGMKGKDTLSTVAISVRGAVRNTGKARLNEIFARNPYMAKIHPTEESRNALEVFQLYRGEGEYFDLSQLPPYRQSFSFGGDTVHQRGYRINSDLCTACRKCQTVCPQNCISDAAPRQIDTASCLHCGNCFRVCPAKAVEKLS